MPLEPEVYDLIFTEGEPDGLWPVTPDSKQHTRRSIYLFNKRNVAPADVRGVRSAGHSQFVCLSAREHLRGTAGIDPDERAFVRDQGKAMADSLVKSVGSDRDKQSKRSTNEPLAACRAARNRNSLESSSTLRLKPSAPQAGRH